MGMAILQREIGYSALKWLNSSVYHNLHQEKFHGNYGLYFTFWDRLCGTLRTDSADKIDEVHQRMAKKLAGDNRAAKLPLRRTHSNY